MNRESFDAAVALGVAWLGRLGEVVTTAGSAHDEYTRALLSLARCFNVEQAIYVSTPITSGRAYLEWRLRARDHRSRLDGDHLAAVRHQNLHRAAVLVAAIRRKKGASAVIDPTRLGDIPHWTQPEYRSFWVEIIKLHATSIVFADGWQYSSGCATEFVAGAEGNLPLYDHELRQVSVATGIILLRDASLEMEEAGLDPTVLRAAVQRLDGDLYAVPKVESPTRQAATS